MEEEHWEDEEVTMASGWNVNNPVFANFLLYAGVLAIKMIAMGTITAYYRIKKSVFANPEDAEILKKEPKFNDPDVERVRRAHQNDCENLPIFWILGLLFVHTDPSPTVAMYLYRIYCITRISHSVLYLRGSKLRPIPFIVGVAINIYMGISVVMYGFSLNRH
ncbi:unnamed protein product [Meganyctiphanes norvegica]|uniref:Microsomal glutathione S-transferase 1 n=1 Tax=Meganyctiphanes norvegica TaxID=48144 RepID=A0AAV2R9K9_MEGNR